MSNVRTSSLPSCQGWIEQFSPEDKLMAKKIIDELIYIETSSVIDDLVGEIKNILKKEGKVSIIPVREVLKSESSYYDLDDPQLNPTMNISVQPLGSEAIISNLITRLRRGYGKSVVLEFDKITKSNKSPSINYMRKEKVKALILVDDVIGSGKRTVDFFNFLYKNKTIKSWISRGYLNVYVVCYMATSNGLKFVDRNIKKGLVKVISINQCPTFYDSEYHDEIATLCERYADVKEQEPLGFRGSFAKVIFEHSAPNNIPTILYKNIDDYKANGLGLLKDSKNWIALFPNRFVSPSFVRDMAVSRSGASMQSDLAQLLHVMTSLKKSNIESLVRLTKIQKVKLKHYLRVCHNLGILNVNDSVVKTTSSSKYELRSLIKDKKHIDTNKDFYYPKK
ncbi:hypothetical protein [Aliivibrio fischeri]|uniref:phosphoribosyltransferase-like protein n=1 Tax=Aliivibrio fischeri TaxID=668 RepID=UPI0012D85BB4|nr:hypothetical protein [Aliivibrio fischeri]MUJ21356.1 hypothetical protein [Aliivibrio fischeri]